MPWQGRRVAQKTVHADPLDTFLQEDAARLFLRTMLDNGSYAVHFLRDPRPLTINDRPDLIPEFEASAKQVLHDVSDHQQATVCDARVPNWGGYEAFWSSLPALTNNEPKTVIYDARHTLRENGLVDGSSHLASCEDDSYLASGRYRRYSV